MKTIKYYNVFLHIKKKKKTNPMKSRFPHDLTANQNLHMEPKTKQKTLIFGRIAEKHLAHVKSLPVDSFPLHIHFLCMFHSLFDVANEAYTCSAFF